MKVNAIVIVSLLSAWAFAAACEEEVMDVCEPGSTRSCPCAEGGKGTQTCGAAGNGWSACNCENADPTEIETGIWTGATEEGLEVSFVLNDDAVIERVDIVYQESDGNYNRAYLKDASQGPFIVEDEVQLEISDSVDIEGMELEALLNVRLTFASRTEASGVVAVAERENSSETAIALKWQQALPAEGPVRDGEWEMSTTDPILLAISFEVVDGIAEDLSYWLMDSSTLSIGYSGISREARIGEGLSLSIVDGVDVSVDFTGYMDAEATASVHFTTGFEQLPLDVEWFPSLPE